jgi:predicted acyltransferase
MNNTTQVSRLTSVDAYRGFVMLLMMGEVLQFGKVSEALPNSGFWQFLAFHQDHVDWVGCSLHDMIQPSFSFLVGVALPFSIASRAAKGDSFNQMLFHTIKRSLILILLGIFLRSMHAKQTYFTFEDTLSQIGLGYTFLFLLGFRSFKVILISLAVILIGYFLVFAMFPVWKSDFRSDYDSIGVPYDWEYNLSGYAAHWNKNTNLAWYFDRWFLNLFPRESPFLYNEGGYVSLSFIPTLGTMILGLIAGNELKNSTLPIEKIKKFALWGGALVILGLILNYTGICPNVKRIWTPTWVLFSGGLCFLFLTFFYGTIDILKTQKWYLILTVIGVNSIAAYVIAHTVDSFIRSSLTIHLGRNYANIVGTAYAPLLHGFLILFFEWLILYWMYQKRLFIKI